VLCRGFDYGVPRNPHEPAVRADFELFYRRLKKFTLAPQADADACRISLANTAKKYATSKPDTTGFNLSREHMKALRDLRRNDEIVITKPDKGRAIVVLSKDQYAQKMEAILTDETKFKKLGPAKDYDKTEKVEKSLDQHLMHLMKSKQIEKWEYEAMTPDGSSRPRAYGLPKIHKQDVPLRPILSMSGSPQFSISKWLADMLAPVLSKYSTRCVKDSFEFGSIIRNTAVVPNAVMCSYDVVSLFTNVPLAETIDICCQSLYHSVDIAKPSLHENEFRALMLRVTSDVQFSFGDIMYQQCDGVAMGSPLGPVLANIFVGHCESLIPDEEWPRLYRRFVDDSFVYCDSKDHCDRFLSLLNSLHPALKFTVEYELHSTLSFLDVKVHNDGCQFITSIYRKPTFTGLYIPYDSFTPMKYKINS